MPKKVNLMKAPKPPRLIRRSHAGGWEIIFLLLAFLCFGAFVASLGILNIRDVNYQPKTPGEVLQDILAIFLLVFGLVFSFILYRLDRSAVSRQQEEYKHDVDHYNAWRDEIRESKRLELELEKMRIDQSTIALSSTPSIVVTAKVDESAPELDSSGEIEESSSMSED